MDPRLWAGKRQSTNIRDWRNYPPASPNPGSPPAFDPGIDYGPMGPRYNAQRGKYGEDIYDQLVMGELPPVNNGITQTVVREGDDRGYYIPSNFSSTLPPEPTYFEGNMPRPRPLNALEQLQEQQERDSKFRVRSVPMKDVGFTPEGHVLPPGPQSWTETPQETIGTHGGPGDLIAPPSPPQQDTQSVAAVFGSPQSGATAMAEDPRQKAARIAREAFGRDPSLIKEFMPKLQAVGVDPALGAPEGWSLPDTGTLTADDMAAPWNGPAPPPAAPLPPELIDPGAGGRPFSQSGFSPTSPFADPAMNARIDQTRSMERVAPPPDFPRYDPLISPSAPSMQMPSVTATANQGPPSPAVGSYAGGAFRAPRPPQARPPIENLPVADIFSGGGAGPFAGNMPRPRPEMGPQFAGNMPQPRPAGGMAFAGNMPQPRPDMPQDVAARSPLIDPGRLDAGLPSPAAAPLSVRTGLRIPDDASMPPGLAPPIRTGFGNEALSIDPATGMPRQPDMAQQMPVPAPIDPAAIAEARQTLQRHPDTGRIRTAPGFQQFNEPARVPPVPGQAERPLIRPDLTQAAANFTPPARLPRARPPDEAMAALVPQNGLPTSVMESIRAGYDPRASGGPVTPETPEEAAARRALIAKGGRPDVVPGYADPDEGLIAGPEVGAINAGQRLPPPPDATVQQTIDAPTSSLAAAGLEYAGPTAKSRQTGFLGNLFDREHFVGGPGLTASPSTVGTDYTKSAKPGRGKYKPAENERLARNIGKTAGLLTSVVGVPSAVGVPLFGAAGAMVNRALDPNRQIIERGPFRFFGGIFGGGTKKKSERDKLGTPPSSEPAGVREAAAAASRSGLGSDRYSGGTYNDYSTGGRYINEGIGGRFGNR